MKCCWSLFPSHIHTAAQWTLSSLSMRSTITIAWQQHSQVHTLTFFTTHTKVIIYFSPQTGKKFNNNTVSADWESSYVSLQRSYVRSLRVSVCRKQSKVWKAQFSSVRCKPTGPRSDSRRPYAGPAEWTCPVNVLMIQGFVWAATQECGSTRRDKESLMQCFYLNIYS